MDTDPLTFGLAWLGYALLSLDFARGARGSADRRLSVLTAVVVVVHVACVYAFRFDGSLSEAWNKSAAGFVLFHSALGAIVVAPFMAEPWRTRCVIAAFCITSPAVQGAPFRYPELAVMAGPLMVTFAVAVVAAFVGWRRGRAES